MVNIWSVFIQGVLPAVCSLCGTQLRDDHRICDDCRQQLPLNLHGCACCDLPLEHATPPGSLCGDCQKQSYHFDRVRAALHYRPPVDDLISGFKYHQRLDQGRLLADLLTEHLLQQQTDIDLLLPMPLHPRRLRERGFNQASELCRPISRALQIPWSSAVLQRSRDGAHQRTSSSRQRRRNIRQAFDCRGQIPRRVALIDDVVTTGATADEVAHTLKKAGAQWVEVWAVARTPKSG